MKKISLVLIVILLLFTASCKQNKAVITEENFNGVTVSNTLITTEQVLERIKVNNIRNKAFYKTFSKAYTDKKQIDSAYESIKAPTDFEGALNELIEAEVLRQNAKNPISLEKAKELYNTEFSYTKTEASQKNFYESLKEVLKENNMSEAEFTELNYSLAYDSYNILNAKSEFANNDGIQKDATKTINEQFYSYKQELIKSTKIIYK